MEQVESKTKNILLLDCQELDRLRSEAVLAGDVESLREVEELARVLVRSNDIDASYHRLAIQCADDINNLLRVF